MKSRLRLQSPSLIVVGLSVAALSWSGNAMAASAIWLNTGATNANWSAADNWNGGVAPGATEIATFNSAVGTYGTSSSPILIDSTTLNIAGINFDTAAGNFYVGTTGGNSIYLSSGGATQILSTLTATNAVETINSNLVIQGAAGTYTFANNSANGTGAGAGAGTLNFGGQISGGAAGATVLTLNGSNTNLNTISGAIVNGSATTMAVTKSGAGTWVLSGANTYTGATTVSGGTLKNGSATTFTSKGTLGLTSNGVFDLNGFNAAFNGLSDSATTTTITNAGASDATLTLKNGGTFTLRSLLTDGPTNKLALTFLNTSDTSFSSANTFSGGITLTGGSRMYLKTLITTTGAAGSIVSSPFGRGAITLGTSAVDRAGILFGIANNNTLANDIVFNTALGSTGTWKGIRMDTSGNTLSGKLTAKLADVTFSNAGGASLTGQITGGFGLTLLDLNNITLNNAGTPNDYAGNTTVSAVGGILALGRADQIPNGAGKGNVALTGTLNLGGNNETINGLSGAGVVDGVSGAPIFMVGDANATSTFSGVIQNTAGNLSLTKTGTGTLTLTGANTYTGATTVNLGTLLINGVQMNAIGPVTVNNLGYLGGNGTIGGATSIEGGGHYSPGLTSSVDSQSFSSGLEFKASSIFSWDLASYGTSFDTVTVTGALAIDSTAVFQVVLGTAFNANDWKASKDWNIATVTGTHTTTFENFDLYDPSHLTTAIDYSSYGKFSYSYGESGNTGTLTWTAVPEPTSALAGLLLGAGFLRRRRTGVPVNQ